MFIGKLNSAKMANMRSALTVLTTLIHVVAPFLVIHLDSKYKKAHVDSLLWTENEDGWPLHASCSAMEWLVFFINEVYTASFYWEFKKIKLRSDKVIFL